MSHMLCYCGNDLCDNDGSIVYNIYKVSEIRGYISSNGDKIFGDLYEEHNNITEDNPYLWICNKCKRVHVWTEKPKYCFRAYTLTNSDNASVTLDYIKSLNEYLIFNINDYIDETMLSALINNNPIRPYKYFATSDLNKIYIVNVDSSSIEKEYSIEVEDYNEYNIETKEENKLIYKISKANQEKTFKYINGERIDMTENNFPLTQVNYMTKDGSISYADESKTKVYDKYGNLLSDGRQQNSNN